MALLSSSALDAIPGNARKLWSHAGTSSDGPAGKSHAQICVARWKGGASVAVASWAAPSELFFITQETSSQFSFCCIFCYLKPKAPNKSQLLPQSAHRGPEAVRCSGSPGAPVPSAGSLSAEDAGNSNCTKCQAPQPRNKCSKHVTWVERKERRRPGREGREGHAQDGKGVRREAFLQVPALTIGGDFLQEP